MRTGEGGDIFAAEVAAADRGFLYGDALFETMLCLDGVVPWLDYHVERMQLGSERLFMGASDDRLRHYFQQAIPAEGRHILRLTLSRGCGARGYGPDGTEDVTVRARLAPLDALRLQPSPHLDLGLSTMDLGSQPLLAGIKHCNRLEQVLAAREAAEQSVDDVLVGDGRQGFQCAGRANLLVLTDEGLVTPACDERGIAGTRRRVVMEQLAPRLNLPVREAPVSRAMLRGARAVMVSNAVLGLAIAKTIDGEAVTVDSLAVRLQHSYFQELNSWVAD